MSARATQSGRQRSGKSRGQLGGRTLGTLRGNPPTGTLQRSPSYAVSQMQRPFGRLQIPWPEQLNLSPPMERQP